MARVSAYGDQQIKDKKIKNDQRYYKCVRPVVDLPNPLSCLFLLHFFFLGLDLNPLVFDI